MNSDDFELQPHKPIRTFSATPRRATFAYIAIGAVGGFLAFRLASAGRETDAIWVGFAVLSVMGVVWATIGRPQSMTLTDNGLTFECKGQVRMVAFSQFTGISSSWTDIQTNRVYQSTWVSLNFHVEGCEQPTNFSISVMYNTIGYDGLEAVQHRVASAIAAKMLQVMKSDGQVQWTERLVLTDSGFYFTKNWKIEPQFFSFHEISRCEVSDGLLKIAMRGESRPRITERTNRHNFMPGMLLFKEFCTAGDIDSTSHAEAFLVSRSV